MMMMKIEDLMMAREIEDPNLEDRLNKCPSHFAHSAKRSERRAYRSAVRYLIWTMLVYGRSLPREEYPLPESETSVSMVEAATAKLISFTGCDYASAYRFFKREFLTGGDCLLRVQQRIDWFRSTPILNEPWSPWSFVRNAEDFIVKS